MEIKQHKKSQAAVTSGGSVLSRYQSVIVGKNSIATMIYYEFCMFLSIIPGALGLVLRKIFWPNLFGSCGKGIAIGANIVVRHPHRIHLGDRVVLSENCILDARNEFSEKVLIIGNDVILSNNTMLSCKDGNIKIGDRTGIGAQTIIQSTNNCPVEIGSDVMIGPRCYLVGGGSYNTDRFDVPMWKQGIKNDGGIILEDDIWLGSSVSILGGVVLSHGSIAAAGAVITKSVPARAICGGIPAKIIKYRGTGERVENVENN